MDDKLTKADIALLREYLDTLDAMSREPEPPKLTSEDWDAVWPYLMSGEGEPPEIIGQIGIKEITDPVTGKTEKAYYDKRHTEWRRQQNMRVSKYNDAILRAIKFAVDHQDAYPAAMQDGPLKELLEAIIAGDKDITDADVQAVITGSLFASAYLPMLNGDPDRDIMQLSARGQKADRVTHAATLVTKDGHKVKIERFDELQAVLGTSAKKIFDTALLFLTSTNFYRSKPGSITPTVEIPLIEYGEANGYQLTPRTMDTPEEQAAENRRVNERIKELKKSIRRDLNGYKNTTWSGEVTKGRNRGDYKDLSLISSHSITRGIIRINFDIDAATFYVNSFVGQYPTVLLRHDNRKPNAYSIGRKIAFHNSNDNNRAIGTENTLSVRSLLDSAPDIPTIDDIKARGQRNWKDKIKKPLELSLDENIVIGYLSRWEYRDPRTGTTYTPADAQLLTWTQYSRLMVDFTVIDAPEQTERRAARALEKARAAADKEKPRRKRGRPRKAEKKEGGN